MTAYIVKMLIQIFYKKKLLFIEIYFMYSYHAHSRFRGSVNCWAPSMKNRFQVAFFLFEVQKASSLFYLVQNGQGLTWVSCIDLREQYKWSLGCARAFLEAFFDLLLHLRQTITIHR